MYDKELVRDILQQIFAATQKIMQRFERIETVSDFVACRTSLTKSHPAIFAEA